MTRFVVCGETLIDLVPSDSDVADAQRSTWLALSAGGPMNSAVALGRLGADTHFLGRLSKDAFGRQIRRHILGANVQLDLATESSQPTSIAVVSLDEAGTASFGWQVDDLPTLEDSDWLHIASLSCVVSPGAEVLLDWMKGVTCGVSYDINVRPTVISDPAVYWTKVEPWFRVVGQRDGIVKASDADIEFLAQAPASGATARPDGSYDPVAVAAEWVGTYGLGLAVITLGAGGGGAGAARRRAAALRVREGPVRLGDIEGVDGLTGQRADVGGPDGEPLAGKRAAQGVEQPGAIGRPYLDHQRTLTGVG